MTDSNNKRIAINTIYLYLRMLLLLALGLYTSRVLLIALGISDYGIYNVVGGIVPMFVFLNYAMINSTQRYITYELGRQDYERLKLVFSTSINIHAIISVVIFLLSETIGLWFLYNKMVIPEGRLFAAFWVLQFSIVSCVVNIMSAPYNALIIAHEKMSAFAYISLLDAVFKLLIVFAIKYTSFDKLILYASFILLVTIIDRIIYGLYCVRKFSESKYKFVIDKPLIMEMTKFAGWNLFGNFASVCYTQGLNLLLNVFFNPVVNAARGIAVHIQNIVQNFSYNIESAIKPQITKTYAQEDLARMHQLISVSARLSFFALLIVAFPICMEVEQVLNLWLAEVPNHTSNFVRLILLFMLVDSVGSPLLTAVQATGRLKKYQFTVSLIFLLILPLSYMGLKLFNIPEVVFLISVGINIVLQIVKLNVVGKLINLSRKDYAKNVFGRPFLVLAILVIIVSPIRFLLEASVARLMIVLIVSVSMELLLVYTIGLNRGERLFVNKKIYALYGKIRGHIQ